MHKAERLKDLKVSPGPATLHLLKGYGLSHLIGKPRPCLRVGKQIIQAVTYHGSQQVEDYLAVARRRELLKLPDAACS
jgi:hypothetical protein